MFDLDAPVMNIDQSAVRRALDNPKTDAIIYAKTVMMRDIAIAVFISQDKFTKHGVTPPPYLASFRIRKVMNRWRLENIDPAAFWVEFGAYYKDASGHPMILRYRPLGRAMDAMEGLDE
jgi:hypothetical protein